MQKVGCELAGLAIHVIAIDRDDLIPGMQTGQIGWTIRMDQFDHRVSFPANHTDPDPDIAITTVACRFSLLWAFITAVAIQIADRTADQCGLNVECRTGTQIRRISPVCTQSLDGDL